MHVLVDAIPARAGGLATYAASLVAAWAELGTDQIVVLTSAELDISSRPGLEVVRVDTGRVRSVSQPWAQTRAVIAAVRRFRPDALLATVPQVSLVPPGIPEVVVVHDMRHHDRPDQFTRAQRAQRAVAYRLAYRRAAGFITPSERTRGDLIRHVPSTVGRDVTVVRHGADHVPEVSSPRDGTTALAFGHTTNKRAAVLVESWAIVARALGSPPVLHITGCAPPVIADLTGAAVAAGVEDWIRPLPFLPRSEFEQLRASASVLLFPSDYEGFGLPVLEAMRTGVPVAITPDPALLEVAGGHAVVADSGAPEDVATAALAALARVDQEVAAARAHAATFTWVESARATRRALTWKQRAPRR